MSARPTLFPILGSLLLVVLATVAAAAVLKACAVRLPMLSHLAACEAPRELAARDRLKVLAAQRSDLAQRIFELEREIAATQCEAIPYDPNAPLPDDFWANRDLGPLFGCWSLDTTYRTRDVDTGDIRTYREWQMCFDALGNGTQTMRSEDGVVCEGSIRAAFRGEQLGLIEPGNLACSDGGYIHQRQIACSPAPRGQATCDTLQPETGGEATIGFQRSPQP